MAIGKQWPSYMPRLGPGIVLAESSCGARQGAKLYWALVFTQVGQAHTSRQETHAHALVLCTHMHHPEPANATRHMRDASRSISQAVLPLLNPLAVFVTVRAPELSSTVHVDVKPTGAAMMTHTHTHTHSQERRYVEQFPVPHAAHYAAYT